MKSTTMMIALVLVLSAAAVPCDATLSTHRRAAGTELYRVQPTQKVMPTTTTSTTAHAAGAAVTDFETIDNDAKRALHELMVGGGRQLDGYESSSMEYILSLSYAPIMSMTPPPTMMPTPDGTATKPDGETTDDGSNVAPISTAAGNGSSTKNTNDDFNKPATISVTVFLLIAAMAVTALVVRKYKQRAVLMAASAADDQSTISPSVFSNGSVESLPTPV
jgi:hypothetical protein